MSYGVKLSRRATKDFDALPNTMQDRVNRSLDDIAANPRGHHSKKLRGAGNLYRWRMGDWRIVYASHRHFWPWMTSRSVPVTEYHSGYLALSTEKSG